MEYTASHEISPFYRLTHEQVVTLVGNLTDEQVSWQPTPAALSIAFHLWHLARWADDLQAAISQRTPNIGTPQQIWEEEGLAAKWGLDATHLGEYQTGQLLESKAAAQLPLPGKEILLEYARQAFAAAEQVVEVMDEQFLNIDRADGETKKTILAVRRAIMDFLTHDNRHLGMMECLKGLVTGQGTATI